MSSPLSGVTAPSTLNPDRLELARVARRWLAANSPISVVRQSLESDSEALPDFWPELVDLGWVGLSVSEEHGGQGGSLADLVTVLEEWGLAVAPGPFPGSALLATLLGSYAPEHLGPILAGSPGAVAVGGGVLCGVTSGATVLITGELRPVDGGALAEWFLVPVEFAAATEGDSTLDWYLLHRDELQVTPLRSADPVRRLASLTAENLSVSSARRVPVQTHQVRDLAAVLQAAECVGVAAWCVSTSAEYAKNRVQFDRPIGQFQAVKHRCADSLCRLEQARAATWDAAELDPRDEQFPLAAAVTGALAAVAAFECAKDAIQILGGIGYTWEHDVHLYLRRATVARYLNGDPVPWRQRVLQQVQSGVRRSMTVDLPESAEEFRPEVRSMISELEQVDRENWNRELADGGWIAPHWPQPWGRSASGLEQLVIDEEFRQVGIRRPHIQIAGWVVPTLIAHGTSEQQERFIRASLRFDLRWCQLFSEPGAGSDLASVATRAERVEGGWSLTGQKVWTTLATEADWGICLARTDPTAPKHEGITCFLVDMRTPGIEIRPLRELTGFAMFNEVFLDAVLVPGECVVGEVNGGWSCARTTLENERVSMGSGSSFGPGLESVLDLANRAESALDARVGDVLGGLLASAQALSAMGLRTTLRALSSELETAAVGPGPEASIRKLLGVEHEQRVQEVGMDLLGSTTVIDQDDGAVWFGGFLGNRALSIAGGTSEIQRNVIAERLLGLPRDELST